MKHNVLYFIIGMLGVPIVAADPTFELWNKTDHDIYYQLEQDGKKIGNDLFHTLIPESKRSKQSNTKSYESLPLDLTKPLTLYINYKNVKTPTDWNEIIIFNPKATNAKPGKTIYVRLKKEKGNYIFGPQTGPWRGLKSKTERGYSLKNNVKTENVDYERIKDYKQVLGIDKYTILFDAIEKITGKTISPKDRDSVRKNPGSEASAYVIFGAKRGATRDAIETNYFALMDHFERGEGKSLPKNVVDDITKIVWAARQTFIWLR